MVRIKAIQMEKSRKSEYRLKQRITMGKENMDWNKRLKRE